MPPKTLARVDPRWEAFVAREPYFAILAADKYRSGRFDAEREREFFQSGEQLVDWMLQTVEDRLQPEFAPMSALEYGCGVGRLAVPLAHRAGRVTAVDVSPTMLEHASQHLQRHGVRHVELLAPDALFSAPRKFDLVTCYLVLQRMPPREGLDLLRALLGLLGSGGIGIFHLPYRDTGGTLRAAARAVRARVPGANVAANALRGKPLREPFMPAHVYALDDVAAIVDSLSSAPVEMQVVLEQQEGLASAVVFVKLPPIGDQPEPSPRTDPPPIDVKALMADVSIDELNRRAEEYFATLTDRTHQLAKPLTSPEETPALLVDVAQLVQGLELAKGMTVLELGAGTGWLSRMLTQLGCRTILADVSPTALEIARELYARLPVIGDQPPPEYLVFDGRRLDLPDESVDRIVVFHALHHVPNLDEVLGELGRVLKPGGIVGCAEPGPRHSRSPMSQFEMRTYAVVENDVDVHAIWRAASMRGFDGMRLALFHAPAFHVSLQEYEDFLAGGATGARWVESTRGFLRHVRTFFLHKAGTSARDSRSTAGLSARIRAVSALSIAAGRPADLEAAVANTGSASWLPIEAGRGGVLLGAHVYDEAGGLLAFDACRTPVATGQALEPGQGVAVRITLPPLDAGRYMVELDCVAEGVAWFAQVGSPRTTVRLEVSA